MRTRYLHFYTKLLQNGVLVHMRTHVFQDRYELWVAKTRGKKHYNGRVRVFDLPQFLSVKEGISVADTTFRTTYKIITDFEKRL